MCKSILKGLKTDSNENIAYRAFGPIAELLKTLIQMIIGIALVVTLAVKFINHYYFFFHIENFKFINHLHQLTTLTIVSKALAYSTGVELAYMLFTPGPDEAIEPLITGTASALLYFISNNNILELQSAISTLLFIFVIICLFAIRDIFILKKKDSSIFKLISKNLIITNLGGECRRK